MQTKPFFQTTLSLSLALALSAYTIHSTGKSLTPEPTGQVMSAAETIEHYDVSGNWWEIYQSRQLNILMAQVLENNIDLRQAAISVNKTLYQVNILGADLVPSFNGLLSASTSRNLKTGSHGNTSGSQLGLSCELDLWRKLSATAGMQVREYQATRQDMISTCLALINNVTDAYFNIAYLSEAIELAQKSLKQYQEIDRVADVKFHYGRADSSQPTRAKQLLLGVQNDPIFLKNSLDTQKQILRNLFNLKPNEAIAADPVQYRLLSIKSMNLDVPIIMLANRPDLHAVEYHLQPSLQPVKARKRSWYPSITLGTSLSTSSEKVKSAFNIPLLDDSAIINLSFLNWQTMKQKNKTAQANFDSAKLNFEKALTTVLNEANTNYLAYQNAQVVLNN